MLERSVDILRELIAFQTVSTDNNLSMIFCLKDRLEAAGATCVVQDDETGTKANLVARLGPDGPGGIMLSGHTDVVPVADQDWTTDPWKMAERDGLLYGRGACDMKGFIAAAVALAESVAADDLTRPLLFAFTHDEETGCLGARRLVGQLEGLGHTPEIVIIGEPTDMRIIEGHKGCYEYTTRFTGLEGHGSLPDAGVNAAEYAARYVGKLLELREALKGRVPETSRFEPPWTTINVGRIAGGVAQNVIAGKAEIDWEMRPVVPEDADFVKGALADYVRAELLPAMQAVHPAASVEMETLGEVVGLMPMDRNAARDLVAELTGANGADLVAFGTEAGLFQGLGADVVVCGPGSIAQAHKPDEYVSREQMGQCCAMLERLAARLGA